jgi:hypothetical protein
VYPVLEVWFEVTRKPIAAALCLSLSLLARVALGDENTVQMRLTAPRVTGPFGEEVKVRIELENAGGDYWVFYPRFYPFVVSGGLAVPRNELTFLVADAHGRVVQRVHGDDIVDRLMEAGPCDYVVMGPANSFGFTVSLTAGQWKHAFPGRGRYKIQARLVTDARIWLQRRIDSGKVLSKSVHFDLGHVLDGTLETNTVEVDLE